MKRPHRDVSAGATGATEVAPKFSDIPTRGGRFCPPSQRSNLNFPQDYVPGSDTSAFLKARYVLELMTSKDLYYLLLGREV